MTPEHQFRATFERIFRGLNEGDFGLSLTLAFPLIDATGKMVYGVHGTGNRFRRVLQEETNFLCWMFSEGSMEILGKLTLYCPWDGKKPQTLADCIYLVRNSLLHEGTLAPEIEFIDELRFGQRGGVMVFPKGLVWGLVFILTYQPCYKDCCPTDMRLIAGRVSIPLSAIWGSRARVREFFSTRVFRTDGQRP